MQETRTESDSLGPVDVPRNCYWGAQTQRSLTNFPLPNASECRWRSFTRWRPVKLAASRVNRAHGLPAELADAFATAAREVIAGQHDDQFPLAIWQTGSGTHSNMNVNEVIAGRAIEILAGIRGGKRPVHPNDHVNKSQSSTTVSRPQCTSRP